jgi:diguanylate cyclase (GGDEF)-like protein/PAS domain S-box-containing protein
LGFYASVLDQLPYGVYCVDLHRTIIYWNAAAAAITGFQRYEVEGACCAQNILRHVNDAGQALCLNDCPLSATLQDGEVRRDRVYLHHRQGYRVPVWIQVVPWRDRQQNIIGAIETFVPEIPEMTPNGQLLSQLELDDLTQIGNRRFGRMHLEQLIQGLNQRSPWPPYDRGVGHYWHAGTDETRVELGGLLFLDIDHFKMINDRYGHGVGDQVLIMVARTISNTLRHGDYVARWGGEEFIVLLNQTDAVGMQDAAERIRRLVASSGLDHEDHFLQVTVSIGGTLLTPQDSVETALERADAQMYRSKQTGRNCTHIAELPPRPTSGS